MKVKIVPIITRDEESKLNLPVSNFREITINNNVVTNTRDVSLIDQNDAMHNILSDISHGSITPTTFISRNFEKKSLESKIDNTIARVNLEKEGLQTRFNEFKNYYAQSQQYLKELSKGVIADGEFIKIDKDMLGLSEKFIPKITELENYYIELTQYRGFVTQNLGLDLSYCDVYSNGSSEVTRFGINTAMMNTDHISQLSGIYTSTDKKESVKSGTKSSKSQKDAEISKILHPLEVFLIQDAIEFLKEQNNKSVLVDIFVREDDGHISVKDNKLDTHTIVLYYNRDMGKIIVIDPSNTEFSKHISSNSLRLFGQSDNNIEIIIPPIQKIYAPFDKDNVGPMPNQYRDCIDLSVKIAFGLNKVNSYINTEDIRHSDVIKEVTNQKQCSENLFFNSEEAIARIRQASDDNIRSKINKLLISFDKLIKAIDLYDESDSLDLQEKSTEKFNEFYMLGQSEKCIENLLIFYHENRECFNNSIEREINQILGDIGQNVE